MRQLTYPCSEECTVQLYHRLTFHLLSLTADTSEINEVRTWNQQAKWEELKSVEEIRKTGGERKTRVKNKDNK